MRVMADGGTVRIIGISRSAVLDDGRRVPACWATPRSRKIAAPLFSGVGPAPVGAGSGGSFTIAGYGTQDERERGAFGSLHEATAGAGRRPRAG